MGWEKISTIGATAGTDLKESDGTVLNDNAIRNEDLSISQGNSGVLTLNRGAAAADTTTITKAKLNLDYDDGATVGATWGTNVGSRPTELTDGRISTALTASGILDTTVPQAKGGTGLTSNATLLNSAISIGANGALSGAGGGTVTASGISAVQTSLGNAPAAIKNDNISIAASGTAGLLTLTKYSGATDTTTISKTQLGLDYADGATVGATWGTNVGSRPTELTDGRVSTALTASGILDTTVPEAKGGTGLTSAGNAIKNNQITTNANGTLNYDGTSATAPSLASITGIVGKAGGGMGEDISSATGILRMASGTLNKDSTLSTTYTDATDNGTTINSSGNVTGTVDIASGGSITVGNITIDGTNNRILISD
jgi:hypothetical protein